MLLLYILGGWELKQQFKEFFEKVELDMNNLTDDTIVVLDANVLLHIYRFSKEYKDLLLKSLNKVSENIYIPYIVGLEFNLNKQVIKGQMHTKRKDFDNEITKQTTNFINQFNQTIDNIGIKSGDELEIRKKLKEDFSNKLSTFIEKFLEKEMKKEFDLIDKSEDSSNDLALILDGKVGECPAQSVIDKIQEEGITRYKNQQPPGYSDEKDKSERIRKYGEIEYFEKFGDLIIWKDVLNRVKNSSETKINNVIFITDDKKEDWLYILKGRKIGPRAELKREMNLHGAHLMMMDTQMLIENTTGTKIEIVEDEKKNGYFTFIFDEPNNTSPKEYDEIDQISNFLNNKMGERKLVGQSSLFDIPREDIDEEEDSLSGYKYSSPDLPMRFQKQVYKRAEKKLVHKLGRKPTIEEISAFLGITTREGIILSGIMEDKHGI